MPKRIPSNDALEYAAAWLDEADFEREGMDEVAAWLRSYARRAEPEQVKKLADHYGKPISTVRAIVKKNAKAAGISERRMVETFIEKEGL